MKNNTTLKANLLIALLSIVLFLPYLGAVHLLDWYEINFAEASREMIVTGDYTKVMIDFEPFHEKPPLFFWIQSASMNVFGVDEFGARFPNALIGMITLLVLFNFGRRLYDEKFGLLWALAYLGSILPHFYFKTGLIDPLFNLMMFLGTWYSAMFFTGINSRGRRKLNKDLWLAGIFTALAVMTKGPVGYLLPALTWIVIGIISCKKVKFPYIPFIVFSLVAALPAAAWYIYTFASIGSQNILADFLEYQVRLLTTGDAGHGQPFYYHFVVLFFGCFPSSVLMFIHYNKNTGDDEKQQHIKLWGKILLYVVLIVFSIVKTKIVHYSSLAYFPITFLAAYGVYKAVYGGVTIKRAVKWIYGVMGIAWGLAFVGLPLLLMNIGTFAPMIKDEFTRAMLLKPIAWTGIEPAVGIILLAAVIASLIYINREKILNGFVILYAGTAISVFLFMPMIAPPVESMVQGDAVEFYKTMRGKDCCVYPLDIGNYKYGFYFYTDKQPHLSFYRNGIPEKGRKDSLLKGTIKYPVYFVTKLNKAEKYIRDYGLTPVGKSNGLVFLKREVGK